MLDSQLRLIFTVLSEYYQQSDITVGCIFEEEPLILFPIFFFQKTNVVFYEYQIIFHRLAKKKFGQKIGRTEFNSKHHRLYQLTILKGNKSEFGRTESTDNICLICTRDRTVIPSYPIQTSFLTILT